MKIHFHPHPLGEDCFTECVIFELNEAVPKAEVYVCDCPGWPCRLRRLIRGWLPWSK